MFQRCELTKLTPDTLDGMRWRIIVDDDAAVDVPDLESVHIYLCAYPVYKKLT